MCTWISNTVSLLALQRRGSGSGSRQLPGVHHLLGREVQSRAEQPENKERGVSLASVNYLQVFVPTSNWVRWNNMRVASAYAIPLGMEYGPAVTSSAARLGTTSYVNTERRGFRLGT